MNVCFRDLDVFFILYKKVSMGEEDFEEFKQYVYRFEYFFGQKGRFIFLKYILMGVDNLNIVYVYVFLYYNYIDFFLSICIFIFLMFY